MNLFGIACTAIATFLLLQLLILPALSRKLKTPQASSVRRLVFLTLAAQILRSVCLVIGVTLGTVALVVLTAPLFLTHGSQEHLVRGFELVRRVHEYAESVDSGWAILTTVVLTVALWISMRREAKRLAEKSIEEAFQRLKQQAAEGRLPDLPPTEEMSRNLEQRNIRAQRCAQILEKARAEGGKPELADPEKNPELARLYREINLIDEQVRRIDILRRLDIGPSLEPLSQPRSAGESRIASFLISTGLMRSVSAVSKVISVVSLSVLAPALVTLAAPSIADASESTSVRLHQLILANSAAEAEAEWRRNVEQAPQPRKLTPDEEQTVNELSNQFQNYALSQTIAIYRTTSAIGRELAQNESRKRILRQFSQQHEGLVVLDEHNQSAGPAPAAHGTPDTEAQFSDLEKASTQNVEAEVRAAAQRTTPEGFSSFAKRAKVAFAAARAPMSSEHIGEMLMTHILNTAGGQIVDSMPGSGVIHDLAGEYFEPGDLAQEAAELRKVKLFQFLNGIAETQEIRAAPTTLANGRVPVQDDRMTDSTERAQKRVDAVLAETQKSFKESPPTLERATARGAESVRVRKELSDVISRSSSFETRQGAANALASYADYFPGQMGEELHTPMHELAATTPQGERLAGSAEVVAENFIRARSYASLRVFAKVGGVLIGLNPQGGTAPSIVDLQWRDTDRGVLLKLTRDDQAQLMFGPFRAEILQRALAYAADGRMVATTMPISLVARQVLIHPALVNSAIGCETRHIDQFVDAFTSREAIRTEAVKRVETQGALYDIAWATRVLALIPKVPDSAVDKETHEALAREYKEAREVLASKRLRSEAQSALDHNSDLTDPRFSLLKVKTDYFDAALVDNIITCADGKSGLNDLDVFQSCIKVSATLSGTEPGYLESLRWAYQPPFFQSESGVRERQYELDRDLSFLRNRPAAGDPLWPFDFVLEIVFESPREFGQTDDGKALPETPFEFPALRQWVNEEVERGIQAYRNTSLEPQQTMDDLREFTVLQRFFRLALDGTLGGRFPLDKLVALGSLRAHSTPAPVRTLNWNVSPGMPVSGSAPDAQLLSDLGVTRDVEQMRQDKDRCPAIYP